MFCSLRVNTVVANVKCDEDLYEITSKRSDEKKILPDFAVEQ
jgi:hypothetical protein